MGCKTCGGGRVPPEKIPKTAYEISFEEARIQAKAENRMYVVVESNGAYYSECLECRIKANNNDGQIVAYII